MKTPSRSRLRIAFQGYGSTTWEAGNTFFQDLFVALERLGSERPEVVLVKWRGTTDNDYGALLSYADRILTAPYPSAQSVNARANTRRLGIPKRLTLACGGNRSPQRATNSLQHNQIDCSFSVPFEHRSDWSVPLAILVFDLMSHHHPDWFTPLEVHARAQTLARETKGATLLVAKSQSVLNDLQAFAPDCAPRVRLLNWVAHIPPEVYQDDPARVVTQYHLPAKFFYLPNHFWQHKNHMAVLDALEQLAPREIYPVVVCTGGLIDQYHPQHLNQLVREISARNLRDQFIILGRVPRADVYALMRQSICVLNPSQFEGFGMSAAEAHSLGKRALLANLPALREQALPDAVYFDPHDAQDLATKMEALWLTCAPGPDLARETQARALLPQRQEIFARRFVNIMAEACALSPNAH
jgi:glycosyltransferase involved in cell wall biosynthesis